MYRTKKERQKGLDRYLEDAKRTKMPTQTTVSNKTLNPIDEENKIFHNKIKLNNIDPQIQPYRRY